MAAKPKKMAKNPFAGEIKKILAGAHHNHPHIVTFCLGDRRSMWGTQTKLFAVPPGVRARRGDWIVFVGIDASVQITFPARFLHKVITPAPEVLRSTPKSLLVIRIDDTTPIGCYEYTAESAAYGQAVGNSSPKIIIYD